MMFAAQCRCRQDRTAAARSVVDARDKRRVIDVKSGHRPEHRAARRVSTEAATTAGSDASTSISHDAGSGEGQTPSHCFAVETLTRGGIVKSRRACEFPSRRMSARTAGELRRDSDTTISQFTDGSIPREALRTAVFDISSADQHRVELL